MIQTGSMNTCVKPKGLPGTNDSLDTLRIRQLPTIAIHFRLTTSVEELLMLSKQNYSQ
jgi:hypothetical protein